MKTLEDLRTYYDSTLKAELDAMEQRRRKALNQCLAVAGILGLIGLVVGGIVLAGGEPAILIVVLIGAVVVGTIAYMMVTSGYRRDFKNIIVRGVIEFMEPQLRYYPDQGITREQFRASELFLHHIDRYSSEDLVRGRIGQTEAVFSEVHAQYKTTSHSGKTTQTHWHTIFKGVFFIADFNKHFQGRTVVLPDIAQKLFGGFGQTLQALNFGRGELVKLEDVDFERLFVVYSDDQIEARYILSTSLMERICAFRNKRGTDVYLSFYGSRLYAAFSIRENLFEPKLLGAVDFDTIAMYADQLRLATDIVEDLNLNTRIWSKE